MTVKTDRYFRSLKTIDTFIDRALGIKPNGKILSGLYYDLDLLHAALANSYLETVGRRADSIHMAIKQVAGWRREQLGCQRAIVIPVCTVVECSIREQAQIRESCGWIYMTMNAAKA